MQLHFLGACQTVTGSRYLIESGGKRVLVDAGLFQGPKKLRRRNRLPFPVDPASISALVLTHAHVDHSGYIPALVKEGFRGPIYCTPETAELCSLLLPDSGYLQEEEARHANKYGYSKHSPAEPLFTYDDAMASLELFRRRDSRERFDVKKTEIEVELHPAGHILGASSVHALVEGKRIVFSGDVGRSEDALMYPPEPFEHADALLLESTYGARLHEKEDVRQKLAEVVNKTIARGGTVLIPSFAVGRTQLILYHLSELKKAGAIPDVPVCVDSPMAIRATSIFEKAFDAHKLNEQEAKECCDVAQYVSAVEDSKALDRRGDPFILISASGMATGGRVVHHLKVFAPEKRNTVLFVGYQAVGTRGGVMVRGAKQVKIHGEYVPIRAEVRSLHGLSAHADYEELIDWLSAVKEPPGKVFITHGEIDSQEHLRQELGFRLGWDAEIPELGDVWES